MPVGEPRIAERTMSQKDTVALLQRALVGRIGTVGSEGMPYVVPLNFVFEDGPPRIHLHIARQPGHLSSNLDFSSKVCFEVDEPGPLIATGETACETDHGYESAVCFGQARVISNKRERRRIARLFVRRFLDQAMPDRSYKPGLALLETTEFVTVHVDIMTGKRGPVPG
jgi:nitroimidazol reductase NimA-like FMN-containing flavoprotein (pyridoxamine 5'-phosphate oxidase superfamily)